MKSKLLLICLALISNSWVSAQGGSEDCHLFNWCLGTPIFKKNFLYSSVLSDTINIVDTSALFISCKPELINEKFFSIKNIEPDRKKLVKDNSIIIFKKVQRDCVLVYFFFSPYNGGHLSFNFLKNENGDYDIIGYKEGDF